MTVALQRFGVVVMGKRRPRPAVADLFFASFLGYLYPRFQEIVELVSSEVFHSYHHSLSSKYLVYLRIYDESVALANYRSSS